MNNQLDARKTLLDGMMAGLDTYKDKLNTFSLWTDDAQAQIDKMKQKVALSDDLDSVKQQLQVTNRLTSLVITVATNE